MTHKEFGKIQSVKLGSGGYDDVMFGFSFTLGGNSWGVSDFWGTWQHHDKYCKWTKEDQNKIFIDSLLKVKNLLKDAKVDCFFKLAGVPVEAVFEDNTLSSWRILTEVL